LTTKPIILHQQPVIHDMKYMDTKIPQLRANSHSLGLCKRSSRDTQEEVD